MPKKKKTSVKKKSAKKSSRPRKRTPIRKPARKKPTAPASKGRITAAPSALEIPEDVFPPEYGGEQ
jgi:hypothetical protein